VEAPLITVAIERLKNIFAEAPRTGLSPFDVARLSGLELTRCEPILDAFVGSGFLT
jgi:hypothetical protein